MSVCRLDPVQGWLLQGLLTRNDLLGDLVGEIAPRRRSAVVTCGAYRKLGEGPVEIVQTQDRAARMARFYRRPGRRRHLKMPQFSRNIAVKACDCLTPVAAGAA